MKVEIIAYTPDPMSVVSIVAGTSYGKRNVKPERVRHCMMNDHMSVFEHVCFTARIEGISRACSHQLVRHRLASFCQVSQRYTKIDTCSSDWYVVPEEFGDCAEWSDREAYFHELMHELSDGYISVLDSGVKPEDARYLLPEATKTTVCMTMNARELFHFFELRLDRHAQWEIRDMANELMRQLEAVDGWRELIAEWKRKACW